MIESEKGRTGIKSLLNGEQWTGAVDMAEGPVVHNGPTVEPRMAKKAERIRGPAIVVMQRFVNKNGAYNSRAYLVTT